MSNIYDTLLKTKIEQFLIEEELEQFSSKKQKDSFWASETEKPLFDIYHNWMRTPPTNPKSAETLIMFSSAKMLELAFVSKLQQMGLAQKITEQHHFSIEREHVYISGYTDCLFTDGTVGEIKSYYGFFMEKELQNNQPRTSDLKQLSIYLDALNQERGKLIYIERGNGKIHEFTLLRETDTKFKCLQTEFDIKDTYLKWSNFYENNVLKNVEPNVFECGKYKEDIDKINWNNVSKNDISMARNGKKVIGSDLENHWKILYSLYKNLWVKQMGQTLGYSDTEIQKIKELTKNYSKK